MEASNLAVDGVTDKHPQDTVQSADNADLANVSKTENGPMIFPTTGKKPASVGYGHSLTYIAIPPQITWGGKTQTRPSKHDRV